MDGISGFRPAFPASLQVPLRGRAGPRFALAQAEPHYIPSAAPHAAIARPSGGLSSVSKKLEGTSKNLLQQAPPARRGKIWQYASLRLALRARRPRSIAAHSFARKKTGSAGVPPASFFSFVGGRIMSLLQNYFGRKIEKFRSIFWQSGYFPLLASQCLCHQSVAKPVS
jgi:hypothetical protein